MAAARPMVTVQAVGADDMSTEVAMPAVLLSPIRTDVVHFVHTCIAKNARQPYAVASNAGHQHSAESWGTGRAVSRVPRVSGTGTHRNGQSAFTNQSRKGRMFAPTKTWRKWHRKVSVNQRRYAVASALAATALPALLQARGHKLGNIAEVPLVVSNKVEELTKTKDALKMLEQCGCIDDVNRAKSSRRLRSGVAKLRGRRHIQRLGPLVIYEKDQGLTRAFRNLPGVDLCRVDALNLLQLAPGGHVGRLCIFTASAFMKLDALFGTSKSESELKKGYRLPRSIMTNTDLSRLINSDEIQACVRPTKPIKRVFRLKKNPLKNLGALVKLNPYAMTMRRAEILQSRSKTAKKQVSKEKSQKLKDSKKAWVASVLSQ